MPNILILFLFFLLMVSILKSENDEVEHLIFVENKLPESRLLIDSQIKKKKNNNQIKKKYNRINKLEEKKEAKSIKKLSLQKNYNFQVNFMPEEEMPSTEEIQIFYKNLVKINKKTSITIKAYAQKRKNDSTSKVRRLSLKRALFLRSLFFKEGYDISKIYIKALGHDTELKGNKDIVVITNN